MKPLTQLTVQGVRAIDGDTRRGSIMGLRMMGDLAALHTRLHLMGVVREVHPDARFLTADKMLASWPMDTPPVHQPAVWQQIARTVEHGPMGVFFEARKVNGEATVRGFCWGSDTSSIVYGFGKEQS